MDSMFFNFISKRFPRDENYASDSDFDSITDEDSDFNVPPWLFQDFENEDILMNQQEDDHHDIVFRNFGQLHIVIEGNDFFNCASEIVIPCKRVLQVESSDDEDGLSCQEKKCDTNTLESQRNKKRLKLQMDDNDEEEEKENEEEKEKEKEEASSNEEECELPKPIGEHVRVSGKGESQRRHFESFEYNGIQFKLEDFVVVMPERDDQKPYVAIIKDISQTKNGGIQVTGQWFYRPEEAEEKGDFSWESHDSRELFYSFHTNEIPAESVLHTCVVHFVPLHKQPPCRRQYPGFVVQMVYDIQKKKLWHLIDKNLTENEQEEIVEHVKKTIQRLGELPELEPDEVLDVSREEETYRKGDQSLKPERPRSCATNSTSEMYGILLSYNALTGDLHRDKCLEKLLASVQYMFDTDDESIKNSKSFVWPDVALPTIVSLEKASYDSFSSDYQKYNQKLRQLIYNLKNNTFLARRLLNGELEPLRVLNMTPNELKEGLTADEKSKDESDETRHMQMTDARCNICDARNVALKDIIHIGQDDRYMLECNTCGHSWSAPRDAVSVLTL